MHFLKELTERETTDSVLFLSTIHYDHDFESFGIEYLFCILHEVSNLSIIYSFNTTILSEILIEIHNNFKKPIFCVLKSKWLVHFVLFTQNCKTFLYVTRYSNIEWDSKWVIKITSYISCDHIMHFPIQSYVCTIHKVL